MKLLFFNILFLYFFLNFHFSTLEAQKLNHRLGEFIIKLENNSKIEQVLTQSNLLLFTKSDLTVKSVFPKNGSCGYYNQIMFFQVKLIYSNH